MVLFESNRNTMKEFLDIIFVKNEMLMFGRSPDTISECALRNFLSSDKSDKAFSSIVDEIYKRGTHSKNIECEDLGDYFLLEIPVYDEDVNIWTTLEKATKFIYGTLTKTNPTVLALFCDKDGINRIPI